MSFTLYFVKSDPVGANRLGAFTFMFFKVPAGNSIATVNISRTVLTVDNIVLPHLSIISENSGISDGIKFA